MICFHTPRLDILSYVDEQSFPLKLKPYEVFFFFSLLKISSLQNKGLTMPKGMAIDWIGRNVYITDSTDQKTPTSKRPAAGVGTTAASLSKSTTTKTGSSSSNPGTYDQGARWFVHPSYHRLLRRRVHVPRFDHVRTGQAACHRFASRRRVSTFFSSFFLSFFFF
jgi:hypothetical protein